MTLFGAFEGVLRHGAVLLGAEDEPHGRILASERPVLTGVVQVEVHLAGVGVRELAQLQVDDDQALEAAVKE